MSEHISVDRATIRAMIEDNFRSVFAISRQNPEIAKETSDRFFEGLEATASLMPTEQAQEFLQIVVEENSLFMAEYRRDPTAAVQRLGLSVEQVRPSHHRQSLADVAVRTAVRATVWESVDSLFRLFR